MDDSKWYSAKTVCKHHQVEDGMTKFLFEERVVLFRATSFGDAIYQAESEAASYCANPANRAKLTTQIDYLDYVVAHRLGDEETVGGGTEIFSLLRASALSSDEYLDRFLDDGHERSQRE